MKIVVLASGNGSNFEVIANNFNVSNLIVNKKNCVAIDRAAKLNIECDFINDNEILFNKLKELNPDLICLAGYMRIIPSYITDYFENKIINIHPSLLPKYTGLHAFERSFENMDEYLGATIHYVDSGLDTGEIIKQIKFKNNYNLSKMQKKLKDTEHQMYVDVIKLLKRGNDEKNSVN